MELLLTNGRIYTMDGSDTVSDALLLRDGRVAMAGTRRDLERLAPSGAARLDLEGAVVVPGLIDTHPHLMHYGTIEAPLVRIWDCTNHDEIVSKLAERDAS